MIVTNNRLSISFGIKQKEIFLIFHILFQNNSLEKERSFKVLVKIKYY